MTEKIKWNKKNENDGFNQDTLKQVCSGTQNFLGRLKGYLSTHVL